jgi:NADH-quinone oxidoreductase subunit L
MRKMGGLIKKTPVTACVMIFAFLAIIGFPGFAGFWSKDLILERLFMNGSAGVVFYTVGLFTAVITAVYMSRLMILTFFGEYRGSKESEEHIHEAPASMLIPMVVLAFGAIFAGYLWADSMGIKFFSETLAPVVGAAQAYNAPAHAHVNPMIFAGLGTLAALVGMFIAYKVYGKARVPAAKGSSAPEGYKATWTFFFDILHKYCGIIPVTILAWICDVVVDKILQAIQWTVGAIATIVGDGATVFQVRKVRLQVAFSIVGVAALVLVVLLTGGIV